MRTLLSTFTVAIAFFLASSTEAFDCPNHFAQAEAKIKEATKALQSLEKGSPLFKMIHASIDDAKMYLHGAKHNHEKPQGDFDHGRAIAKAGMASAYAEQALENAKK